MRTTLLKKTFLVIGIFTNILSFNSYAQKTIIEEDSIEIEFMKNEKLDRKHPETYIGTIVNGFRITLLEVNVNTLDFKKEDLTLINSI